MDNTLRACDHKRQSVDTIEIFRILVIEFFEVI